MANSTMLQLINQAQNELGLTASLTVAGNTNSQVVQMLALLNATGYELARVPDAGWQAMVAQYITTVAYTTLTLSQPATGTYTNASYTFTKVKYAMPSDYDRQIDRTHWDKSKHWEMLGPETAQEWEWLISGYISTGPRIRYRIFGNYFQIWPFVAAAETIGFEYLSKNWVLVTAGTLPTKASFTVDTDTCIYPDRLMVLGLKLKFMEIKGADTTAVYRDYMAILDEAVASDAGSKTLSFTPRRASVLLSFNNIPDANYGQ